MADSKMKISLTFWLSLTGAVLAAVGILFSLMSSSGAYAITRINMVIFYAGGMVVVNIILAVANLKMNDKVLLDILRLGAVVLGSMALVTMISARAELMGYIYFSDLESGNPVAVAAMNNGILSWVFYGLALLTNIICGFRKINVS